MPLAYVAGSVSVGQSQPAIGQIEAVDLRRERDPTWIGIDLALNKPEFIRMAAQVPQ